MLLIITRTARTVTATGLAGVATVMHTSADLIGGISSVLRPAPRTRSTGSATERVVEDAPSGRPSQLAERARRAERQARARQAERARQAPDTDEDAEAEAEGEATDPADATQVSPDPEATAEDVAASFEERGRVKEPTQVGVPDVTHASAPPSHIAELASGSVAQVVAKVDELSTDELRQLLEHETTTKRRRAILDAVEQALTP
jgi:hypothetical protein